MLPISVKYRLYPTKAQASTLDATLDTCRQVYNSLVNERAALYETTGSAPTLFDQQRSLTRWKPDHPELGAVHAQVLQNVAVRVDLAFQAFFRRVKAGEKPGYPRMKGRGWYDSLTFPQAPSGCALGDGKIVLSKIGAVKAVLHRPLPGKPKTCTIGRQSGKWYACYVCECEPQPLPASSEAVGIDMGLEKFAALSDGTFIANPRFFRQAEKTLAKAARKQAKTPKRSPARRKANKVLARVHERVRNRRHDFVHQNARRIVNRFGRIAVEKLNVVNMQGNHSLAKSIADASWSMFRTVLAQKAASAAREVIAVNPAYTSQDCSGCGYRAKKPLKVRWHLCPMCGLSLDRDSNAAVNILKAAVGQYSVAGAPA